MGKPSAPVADWPFAEEWQALGTGRAGRVLMGVLSWLAAFVIALFADSSDADSPIPQSVRYVVVLATPLVLVARPRLGCAVAVVSAVLLGIAGEPPSVVVPFAVNAALCAYFLARFLIGPRRQRRLFAQIATPVSIELPADDVVSRRVPALRVFVISCLLVLAALAVWAWSGNPGVWLWVGVIGFVLAVQITRLTAVRLAARRLVSRPGPGVQVLISAEQGPRLILFTADKHRLRLAWLPLNEIVHRSADAETPDVRAFRAAIPEVEDVKPPDDLFPATVVGDFRVGGYVAIVTDHAVLLPGGPLRALSADPPMEIPTRLVDGRQWSGLKRPA
ncbi:hypothetical protein [Saccharothrix sp. ALI-22-I]|uniref:hypothetical protein n=1 Tax=Saccharothrix sp. ALI-22-I TaxID=1933778 RepID=UPI00117A6FD9|nr:hypothetical protein [Saccharothrix sp. ALI-22-I]